ncbi:MAG TPA: hypothetical protein VGH93_01390 [Solirubrobacteraceae bacterium]
MLGAQGVLGSVSARAFQREGWRVVRAGRRPGDGVSLVDLDRPETLREALDGIDVVVNPVPEERLAAERVVLEAGPALVNLSTSPASAGRALRREATSARGLVLIHGGVAPGVTGLVAADLLRLHPDADEVELAFTISAGGTSGRSGAGFIHRYLSTAAHHRTFQAELDARWGTRTCFEIGPEERGWLSDELVAGRAVRLGIYFRERALQALFVALNRVHLMRAVPRFAFVARRRRVPAEPSAEPIAEWIAVRRAGERLAARRLDGHGDYRMTAMAALVFAQALVELRTAEPERTGVYAPEELFTLDRLWPQFRQRRFELAELEA